MPFLGSRAQTICRNLDGRPSARSERGIIRLLAFDYIYFRLDFYFRFHYLVKRQKRKSIGDSVLYFGDHVELNHEAIVPGVPHDPSVAGLTWFGFSGYRGLGEPLFTRTNSTNQDIQTHGTFSWVQGKPVSTLESD
jgi:hypothetical protein